LAAPYALLHDGTSGDAMRTALALARGALPALAVATLIPLGLFYTAMLLGSIDKAIVVSVCYAYSVGLWQYLRRGRVSGMLMVTMFMVSLRGITVLASGQAFFYFLAPVIETVGFGLMFVVSLLGRESLIVRLARDLVPHVADDLAERDCLCSLLSVVWALTYIGSGATTFLLLITQPVAVYMGAHQLSGWAWDATGLTASILLCRWRARDLLHLFKGSVPVLAALPLLVEPAALEPALLVPLAA
jgi:intracellular septation protein A